MQPKAGTRSIWDLPEVLEEATFENSSGCMSPDPGDTWHQMSPQWVSELELVRTIIMKMRLNVNMNKMRIGITKDWTMAAGGARDYISEVRESSLWAPLCDCLTPADVLRTTGSKWYNAELYGEFAELWFFFMKREGGDGPPLAPLSEWPSLCFDYRQNFGFDNGMSEPGRLPDLTAFEDSGKWT